MSDFDKAVDELSSSYSLSHTSFKGSLTSLIERSLKYLKTDAPRPLQPFWYQSLSRFNVVWLKTRDTNEDSFKGLFVDFLKANPFVSNPLFTTEDDGKVHDSFFKTTERMVEGSAATRSEDCSVSGPVVLLKEGSIMACLPIGEMYRAAIRVHITASSTDIDRKLLPTLTLLDFYACLYHSSDEKNPSVTKNVNDLCDAAETVGPGTGPGAVATTSSESSPFDAISGLLSGFLGGGTNPEISKTFKGLEGMIKNIASQITEDMPEDRGSVDPAKFIGKIGNLFQSPEIQSQMSETITMATGLMSKFGGSSSEGPTVEEILPPHKDVQPE